MKQINISPEMIAAFREKVRQPSDPSTPDSWIEEGLRAAIALADDQVSERIGSWVVETANNGDPADMELRYIARMVVDKLAKEVPTRFHIGDGKTIVSVMRGTWPDGTVQWAVGLDYAKGEHAPGDRVPQDEVPEGSLVTILYKNEDLAVAAANAIMGRTDTFSEGMINREKESEEASELGDDCEQPPS